MILTSIVGKRLRMRVSTFNIAVLTSYTTFSGLRLWWGGGGILQLSRNDDNGSGHTWFSRNGYSKKRLICDCAFELYFRWVPLKCVAYTRVRSADYPFEDGAFSWARAARPHTQQFRVPLPDSGSAFHPFHTKPLWRPMVLWSCRRVLNKFWSRRLKYKSRRREKRSVIVYSKFMTEK